MAQVTIEGSKTNPTTFLKPGARITVERTSYINKLIAHGYVNTVQTHEEIRDSPEAIMSAIEEKVDEEYAAAAAEHALTGAPARNASTDDWRAYLTDKGFAIPATATRAQMITAWEASQKPHGESVD